MKKLKKYDTGGFVPGLTGRISSKTRTVFDSGGEVDPMIQQRIEYTKSPLYRQRLIQQGVKNVDETIAADLANLQGTQFDKTNQQAQTTTRGGKPLVMLTPQDGRYVKAHEIGHAQRGGENIVSSKNPNITKEGQLSPSESWQFYNRNTNLAKPTTESVYDPTTGKMIQKDTTFKGKVLNDYKGSEYFPNDAAVGRLPQWDAHDISSREGYGDLSAVRQILLDNGVTKSFGESITPDQWNKALQNKKISGEKHIQRAIKNYGKGIIDLNNTVAENDTNEITPIAENGTNMKKYNTITLKSLLNEEAPEAKSGIHINPANKGKFNATKKATGKSTEELTHSKNPVTKKRAIFAQNAAKWKHEDGGILDPGGDLFGNNMFTTIDKTHDATYNAVTRQVNSTNGVVSKDDTDALGFDKKAPNAGKQFNIGNIVAGLGIIDKLIPQEQIHRNFLRPEQSIGVNQNIQGTGSQAIATSGKDISPEKAAMILHDGTIRGKKITDRQRRYFGAMSEKASGGDIQKQIDQFGLYSFMNGGDALSSEGSYAIKPLIHRPLRDITRAAGGPISQDGKTILENGSIEQLSNNPYDGGTQMFNGPSHDDGGIQVNHNGNHVEVEGKETKIGDEVMGNLYVPGTKEKFKNVVKRIGKEENKVSKINEKAGILADEADGTQAGIYKLNSAKVMLEGSDLKLKDFADKKEKLVQTQENMLQHAEAHGLDPQELFNNGKMKKAKFGIKMFSGGKEPQKQPDGPVQYTTPDDPILAKQIQQGQYIKNTPVRNAWTTPSFAPDNAPITNLEPYQAHHILSDEEHIATQEALRKAGAMVGDTWMGQANGIKQTGTPQDELTVNGQRKAPYTPEKPLSFLDVAPEVAALATNRVQPVRSQHYTPELQQGYETSLQGARNRVTAAQRAAMTMMGYNPAAAASIAAGTQEQLSGIDEKEFQTNQAMKADVINRNISTLNEARLKNMSLDDQQYARQEEAKSKTRMQDNEIFKSISAKNLQNKADYKKLNIYENMYGFRFDPKTGEALYKGPDADMSGNIMAGNSGDKTVTRINPTTGQPISVTVTKDSKQKDILENQDIKKNERQAIKSLTGKSGISLVRRAKM